MIPYRAAAEAAKDQTHGHCRKCGRKLPLEAHHWTKGPYPPAHLTTENDLTAFCRDCHDEAHDFRFFLDVGGAPEDYRKACSETVATLLLRPEAVRRSLMRVGRAVWCEGRWAALVTGGARPRCGEVFRLVSKYTVTAQLGALRARRPPPACRSSATTTHGRRRAHRAERRSPEAETPSTGRFCTRASARTTALGWRNPLRTPLQRAVRLLRPELARVSIEERSPRRRGW